VRLRVSVIVTEGATATRFANVSVRESILDEDVLPRDVSQFAQTLLEGLDAGRHGRASIRAEKAHGDLRSRLRVDGDRRGQSQQERGHDRNPGALHGLLHPCRHGSAT
jgi:hypothetical protein